MVTTSSGRPACVSYSLRPGKFMLEDLPVVVPEPMNGRLNVASKVVGAVSGERRIRAFDPSSMRIQSGESLVSEHRRMMMHQHGG
jgi:hypothetical protein